jgi:choline dehydrogenase-like flavoprotein
VSAESGPTQLTREPIVRWSPRLLRTLAEVFTTLAPMSDEEARRRAHLAAETLSAVADPDELRLLKLAIGSLQWWPANLITAGSWARFHRLDQSGREAILLRWANHPVARLRTAYQAMKRIGLFLAYADPGEDGSGNPMWPRIGYAPPDPVATPPPSIEPLEVDRIGDELLELEADVVVVGSGAGGGVAAARLAEAGRSVLVIESGPYLRESAMPIHEATAFEWLYLDRGTSATTDLAVTILAGAGLGGGTTINWTTSFAPPDWLRDEWADGHGLEGFDTAQTDDDIGRLRMELDLRYATVMPPKDRAILTGARALGWEGAATERDAGPCTDCGACGFGCRRGAKRSGLQAHLRTAAERGARFLVDAPVDRVYRDETGRATAIFGDLRAPDGGRRPYRVRAAQIVVAAGALRTPLILHASGITHPQVGQNLHLHPTVVMGAETSDDVEMWLGPTQAARSLEFWRPGPAEEDGVGPEHNGFIIESAPLHPGFVASSLPWEGGEAGSARMERARRLVPLLAILRDRGSGSVHWTRHRRARIDYDLSPTDVTSAQRALVELARLGRAAGAEELLAVRHPSLRWRANDPGSWEGFLATLATTDTRPNRLSLFSAHQMGTASAGAEVADHPCDPHGRVRGDGVGHPVPGLYVADSSLFPTPSGVDPMLTVMCLAERSARAVLADA